MVGCGCGCGREDEDDAAGDGESCISLAWRVLRSSTAAWSALNLSSALRRGWVGPEQMVLRLECLDEQLVLSRSSLGAE